jgi:hypothetical protein
VILMLRRHLINLPETVAEKESLRNYESSILISCLGMGVARVIRVNSSKTMVGWKGTHPKLVHWLYYETDKYSHTIYI